MTAPLSGQFEPTRPLATGMFGGKKQTIAPRGSYLPGMGDPSQLHDATAVYGWQFMPGLIGGISRYQGISTITGVPVGTPEAPDAVARLNVGQGGTAAYMAGSSPV